MGTYMTGSELYKCCDIKSMIRDSESEGMSPERLEKGWKDAMQLLKKAIVLMYNEWAGLKNFPDRHKSFGVCSRINEALDEGKGQEFIKREFPVGEKELQALKKSI